jgi:hypothetical protein
MRIFPCGLRSGAGIAAIVAILFAAGAVRAEEIDWKQGKLQHLARVIGTYTYQPVLGDPAVAAALRGLAGDDVEIIIDNLQVAAPIDFIAGHLVLRGLAPHQGGREEATVWVKIYDGTVRAALLHAGAMKLFAPDRRYEYIPRELRNFLRPRVPERGLPSGVEWVGRLE